MSNEMQGDEKMKESYRLYSDKIFDKRYNSPDPLRRYVHRAQYQSIISKINADETVLDAGCGEGVLSCLMAKQGNKVVGVDISEPNIEMAKKLAKDMGVEDKVSFFLGDAENINFPDNNFDTVVSCHVLEHLPDFDKGVRELKRISRKKIIVALPSILNLCSLIQAGHGSFWEKSKKSLLAFFTGFVRMVVNLTGEGVDEGYGGDKTLTHIWRFPWVIKRRLRGENYNIVNFEPSTICLPYFNFFIPLIKLLDKYKTLPMLRNFGYGTTVVLIKEDKNL